MRSATFTPFRDSLLECERETDVVKEPCGGAGVGTHVWQTNQLGNKQEEINDHKKRKQRRVGFPIRNDNNDSIRC